MRQDWIDRVMAEITEKAGIKGHKHYCIEQLEKHASERLGLKRLIRDQDEDAVSYTRRLMKHFGLGHHFDRKIPDASCRRRIQQNWTRYKDRHMGLR